MRMTATTPAHNTAKSSEIFNEAKGLMPGGVSSPVRAFKSVGGEPIVLDRVKGAYCWDVDENKYIDYVGTWGPAICGHANEEVNDALRTTLEKGALASHCLLLLACCIMMRSRKLRCQQARASAPRRSTKMCSPRP
jgi:4-aminobutyrate aminotransferase-like enzyme